MCMKCHAGYAETQRSDTRSFGNALPLKQILRRKLASRRRVSQGLSQTLPVNAPIAGGGALRASARNKRWILCVKSWTPRGRTPSVLICRRQSTEYPFAGAILPSTFPVEVYWGSVLGRAPPSIFPPAHITPIAYQLPVTIRPSWGESRGSSVDCQANRQETSRQHFHRYPAAR